MLNLESLKDEPVTHCDICGKEDYQIFLMNLLPSRSVELKEQGYSHIKDDYLNFDGMVCTRCYVTEMMEFDLNPTPEEINDIILSNDFHLKTVSMTKKQAKEYMQTKEFKYRNKRLNI